jgi:N-acetylglutamate synthase-like GNAT family acetyltransferase
MNWNLTVADFEFMTELEPDGCFVLLENSKRIGLATTINFGAVAWFGNLIVNESYRRKGAGSLLVEHSIKYLRSKRAKTIGLYAYTDRIHFYRRLGFEIDSEFTVLKGKGTSSHVESAVRETEKQDLQEIIEFDHSCFGASRRKLLEPIISYPDNLCFVSVEEGQMIGYVVAKVFRQMGEIGPLMCQREREDVAIDLLKVVLSRLKGYEVSMYVPSMEKVILDALSKLGFTESFRVVRMSLGPPIGKNCINMAESLERG